MTLKAFVVYYNGESENLVSYGLNQVAIKRATNSPPKWPSTPSAPLALKWKDVTEYPADCGIVNFVMNIGHKIELKRWYRAKLKAVNHALTRLKREQDHLKKEKRKYQKLLKTLTLWEK